MRVWLAALVVISFILGVCLGQVIAHHKHLIDAFLCGIVLHTHIRKGKLPHG